MGYELNRLMKQYGVATPGMTTPPPMPGAAPTLPELIVPLEGTTKLTKGLSEQQIKSNQEAMDKYNAEKAAFDEKVRLYGLAQKEYDQYKGDYQNRLANTNMYNQAQYNTSANPIEPQWTDTLRAPIYGNAPITLAGKSAQEKADWYTGRRNIGYTDADLRAAAEKTFGKIPEQDWSALLNTAYPQYVDQLNAAYGQLGRSGYGTNINQIDNPGYNYWMNQLSTGAVSPENLNQAVYNAGVNWKPGATYDLNNVPQQFDWARYVNQNPDLLQAGIDTLPEAQMHYAAYGMNEGRSPYEGYAAGGSVRNLAKRYNVGGAVRKFNIGGNEGVPEDAMEALIRERSASMGGQPPVMLANAPTATATDAAPVTASPAVQPVTPPPSASTPVSPAANDLMSMMSKYLSADSTYQPELAAARKRVTAENAAFQDMIAKAMQPDSSAPDKAEMYFRLAAAFGAPTKTGHFTENLALVGKELGEYAKDVRASKKADKQLRLQLGLEAQKLKSQAARDELTTLRTLAGEEMKDKRAILQEYIKSGMPQSEAGKAAMDAGLVKGTPQFNEFVNKYIDDKIRSGNLLKEAMVAIAAGNLAVAQSRESRTAASAQKLTAPELKLKAEAEDALGAIGDAMSSLSRAYSLNPNTFDGTLASIAQQKILEQTNPKDPRVLATREQQNLLSKGAIANLRTAFGGNPTEGERKALLDLEGIDAKSKEERAIIMKNTYKLLKRRQEREQKRLKDITSGLYRETTPSEGGIE